jgi:NAD-dependent dihydropyrimidine dehydrogenase PreA subunit
MANPDKVSLKKRFSVSVEREQCKGCGRCAGACPKNVLSMGVSLNKMGYPFVVYKGDGCIGCGACFYNCPEPGALTVYEDDGET